MQAYRGNPLSLCISSSLESVYRDYFAQGTKSRFFTSHASAVGRDHHVTFSFSDFGAGMKPI